ncbi:hypothetical protein QOZ80_5AG0389660 [Eleusine coracana subsp. coracana]|nr:hypothetical protein QOZ80_5AG0389660 [Eleusine coracana subsp. coracana]
MMPLNDHDSRRLFFQRIFGSEDACPEKYKNVSQKILRKCGGVPLVIISIASLLASQEYIRMEQWENIQNLLISELETSPTLGWMRHVLNIGYNDLPRPLKTCFLYLAVYPEDYKIEKVNLLRRWIAEGFVSYKYDISPEEVAENFFNELINRNMIQPAGFEYGELTYCQVHDVMLDFILSKAIEENFITMIGEQRSTKGTFEVRRLCLQFEYAHLVPANMNLSQIRSLTIFRFPGTMPYLSRFELLRVLDLYCEKNDGTDECLEFSVICKLFQLRYFRITRYQLILNHVGELTHLETLDIGDAIVTSIPSDIVRLKSLRHLVIPTDTKLPKGIRNMGALHALGFFNLAENPADNIRDLGDLTNLRDLDLIGTKQILKAQGPCGKQKLNSLISSLGKLANLRSLHVCSSSIDSKLASPKCDFLSCWFPVPRNLQRLTLSFCTITKIPEWISQLDNLTSLKIRVKELQRYGVELLGELPCLAYLDLSVSKEPKEDIIFHRNAYPRLREFGFACTFSSVTFEPWSMAKLQVLHLMFYMRRQEQENSSLSGIEHLLNLEQLTARIYNRDKIGASFRDAILRHPRSYSFNILFPRY